MGFVALGSASRVPTLAPTCSAAPRLTQFPPWPIECRPLFTTLVAWTLQHAHKASCQRHNPGRNDALGSHSCVSRTLHSRNCCLSGGRPDLGTRGGCPQPSRIATLVPISHGPVARRAVLVLDVRRLCPCRRLVANVALFLPLGWALGHARRAAPDSPRRARDDNG